MPPHEAAPAAAPEATEHGPPRKLAARYRYPFLDLESTHIDSDLFRSIPVDRMFRHNFVPIRESNGALEIAVADPRELADLDEIASLLGKKLRISIATLSQISDVLIQGRAVPASAGGSHRGIHPRRGIRRRPGRVALYRQAHPRERRRACHQADRHNRVQRADVAPATSTSRRGTQTSRSSTASTACCIRQCLRFRRTGTR